MFIETERRIVDAVVVILRPVKHNCCALKCHGVFGVFKIAFAELLRNDARFHNSAVEKIAFKIQKARFGLHWLVIGKDNTGVAWSFAHAVVVQCLTIDGEGCLINTPGLNQLGHNGGHAT